jgi:hypothetical protein
MATAAVVSASKPSKTLVLYGANDLRLVGGLCRFTIIDPRLLMSDPRKPERSFLRLGVRRKLRSARLGSVDLISITTSMARMGNLSCVSLSAWVTNHQEW